MRREWRATSCAFLAKFVAKQASNVPTSLVPGTMNRMGTPIAIQKTTRKPRFFILVLLSANLLDLLLAAPVSFCSSFNEHSGSTCSRCLNDNFCPIGWKCHATHKLCYDGTTFSCNENMTVADIGVSAHCEYICNQNFPPFACSGCLNEDFPCKWVPGCNPPTSMSMTHLSCTRGCEDHGLIIPSDMGCNSCTSCKTLWGCGNARVRKFCPVTCKTEECKQRCDRDEAIGRDMITGEEKKCWNFIIEDGENCATIIKKGYDCHCSCGNFYQVLQR